MAILFGHQTGNPNAHHAALAHEEAGRLDAFVVPWFPSRLSLRILQATFPLQALVGRLERRRFELLASVPKIQGRPGEIVRLAQRALGRDSEALSYQVNDWLMRTMARGARRRSVTAVHSYEDASLWAFQAAKRMNKACIYDMPIGYHRAWQEVEKYLVRTNGDWLPTGGLSSRRFVRPEQKSAEMELADLVLAPSYFVEKTIRQYIDKKCALAPYGVDAEFWRPGHGTQGQAPLEFIFVGQVSLRKGAHVLLEAWRKANLAEAELTIVGRWNLADHVRMISGNIHYVGPCSQLELRELYRRADVFVFPSFFEGLGLVLLEAMACGLPFIASESSGAGPELTKDGAGQILPTGDIDALVHAFRTISDERDRLGKMKTAARKIAESCRWEKYRKAVSAAVAPYI